MFIRLLLRATLILSVILTLHGSAHAEDKSDKGKAKTKTAETSTDKAKAKPPTNVAAVLGIGAKKGDEKEPLFISSNSLNLDSQGRIFTYLGNVTVNQGDFMLTAEVVVGKYDEKNQLKEIIAEDKVVITKGADLRATSDRANYDVPKGTIELTEGPQIVQKGNALTADKITLYVEDDKSKAEGNVRVKVIKSDEANPSSLKDLAGGAKGK